MFQKFIDTIAGIFGESGFAAFFTGDGWKNLVMIAVACFLLFLAISKKYEPLLLLPIAFGMLLANLPGAGVFHYELFDTANYVNGALDIGAVLHEGGILDILYLGVKLGISSNYKSRNE